MMFPVVRFGRAGGIDFCENLRTMKILVYGAGVLGSLYAARLAESGCDVSILARGRRLQDIREHGIVLQELSAEHRVSIQVNVVERLAPEDRYDLVVVLMNRTQARSILPVLADHEHTPAVLFMCNNAAGPDEWMDALGKERIVLGFSGAGGGFEGHTIRYHVVSGRNQATTFGELDGKTTPRLIKITDVFREAGFPVEISPNMDAWLKSHVAKVLPVALAMYMTDGDNYRTARNREALVLAFRAMKECFRVLKALDIPIEPSKLEIVEWVPERLAVFLMRKMMSTKQAEIVMAAHANAARDEMIQLAEDFMQLARRTSVPTPAMNRLLADIETDQ
jgi:2-dehydropantoate 2-reductase